MIRFLWALTVALIASLPAAQAQPVRADSIQADSLRSSTEWHRAEGFDALPARSVRGIAAWAPGVRRDLATGALTVRAGGGPRFVVDGVRQLGPVAVPFESVQRVRVLTEGVPARFGQAAPGLVLVDTDLDADRFGGRVEAYSSRATDAYGVDLGALAVRGPLGTLGSFELAGEVGRQLDASPTGIGSVQLTDEAFARVQASPQSVMVEENGGVRAVPFPVEAAMASPGPFTEDDLRRELGLAADATIQPGLVHTIETLGADAFERRAAKDDPLDDLRLATGLTLNPVEGMTLRTTGRVDRQRAERTGSPIEQFASSLMNPDGLYTSEQNGLGLATTLDHRVSPTLRYALRASIERGDYISHPFGFSDQVEDALLYGDIEDERSDAATRHFVQLSDGYRQQYTRDAGSRPEVYGGVTYSLPGRQQNRQFVKGEEASVQVGGAVTLSLGAHQLELGAEMEQQTHRQFSLSGFQLAGFANDGNLEQAPPQGFPDGVSSYDQLAYRELQTRTSYIGYAFNGLTTADSEDIDAYYDNTQGGSSKGIAPFQPRLMAGFGEITSSFGPLRTRIGLRLQGYDPNGHALIDPFAPLPIRRAGDLTVGVPEGIGDDFAVYYASNETTVVGFRDLDGRFYDAQGVPTTTSTIIVDEQAQVVQKEGAPRSEAFQDAPTIWSAEPRIAVELVATDDLQVFASAERLSRAPDPSLHVPISTFRNLSNIGFDAGSVSPEFETVDAARLGVRAAASPTLSAVIAGFVRQASGLPVIRPLMGAFPRFGATLHEGELDEIGVDLQASWRPSSYAWLDVGYTLASATSTGLNVAGTANIIGAAPIGIPAPNDSRHALDVVASARVPESAGPWLGGFGGGLVLSAQSGLPYTRLEPNTGFSIGDSFTAPARGAINSARLPWTHQIDLRLDKQIAIGPSTVELFAWIENVLGTENVLAVYRSTGMPDEDGYLATGAGGNLSPEQQALYQAYISGPVNVGGNQSTSAPYVYGQPRQIRLGLRASF